jgi:alpha-glucuronidase
LWDELVNHYDAGIDSVRSMQRNWRGLEGAIDAARFRDVESFLDIQEHEARWWRDATLQYFQTFSRMSIPAGHAPAAHPLSFYLALRCPADRTRPRCPAVY